MKNAGDLKEGEFHVLYLDLARHLIVATHFAAESYFMTREMSRGMISEAGNSIASRLNFFEVVAGVILDGYYVREYMLMFNQQVFTRR
jgi:hypothetical protein